MTHLVSSKRNSIYAILHVACAGYRACAANLRASVEAGQQWRAIAELRVMADYELADIGLSRSDLTPEGLAIAGAKRKAKQGLGDAHPDVLNVAKHPGALTMEIVTELPRHVTLSGQLDSRGAGQIYDELVEFCRNNTADVALDMRHVVSCTRAGCGILFVVAKLLQQNGARLQIRNASSTVLKKISASGFDHLLM